MASREGAPGKAREPLRIHWLQHVPYEWLGSIEPWAKRRGHSLRATRFHADEPLPRREEVDLLVVLGGTMSVHDEERHPWLVPEKRFVAKALAAGLPVLGICLGAQILAEVLGARIHRARHKEIGWFPIRRDPGAGSSAVARAIPDGEPVFHWHGETFDLPPGAIRLASSPACPNQAFLHGDRAVGLQFHLEMSEPGVRALIEFCGEEMVSAPFIQSAGAMLAGASRAEGLNARMDALLDALAGLAAPPAA